MKQTKKFCWYCKEEIPLFSSRCPFCKHSTFQMVLPSEQAEENEDQNVPDENTGDFPW